MEDEERVHGAMGEMKLEEASDTNGSRSTATAVKRERRDSSSSPAKSNLNSRSPSVSRDDVKADDESASTPEEGSAPRLSRKPSQKEAKRAAPLFDHLPDMTGEACGHFQVINDCLYGSKHMGSSEHDALDCDCSPEYQDGENHACGEDSDCINRATKMECVNGECNCGEGCQNQRFQRKQYADVSVVKTAKKGFGLRTNADLQSNDFIFEYIGEVINEPTFRRRMLQYDEEGIKHFYFMSLTKSEFVDATKKGNLGRFCNHSCNPNCYVDKWVVGDKLRMGIFAGRKIRAGEELVFNYNVDRYGADPQPCYCGEPNCTGFIGGKTQTERATKLSLATIEALGIDDGDGWDTAVARKPRKKKPSEDDEEYVNSLQARGLDEDGVTKVMASLMQCKEKWIAVKLLERLQRAEGDRVHHRVVRMHGYQILKTALTTWTADDNVVLQILDILYHLPRLTKNKISDAKIEATVEGLTSSEHEDVAAESRRLLDEWSKLETAYRIPRKKLDPSAAQTSTATAITTTATFEDRRNHGREEEIAATAKVSSPLKNVVIPKGPKNAVPVQQRTLGFYNGPPKQRRPLQTLPAGWFAATDARGQTYFYDKNGTTTWQRPTVPASAPPAVPKGPTKAQQESKALQDIIDSLTKDAASNNTPRQSASQTPQPAGTPVQQQQQQQQQQQEAKREKWRSLSIEKQQKVYENTLFPHVKYVMDKFRHKLPREDLKKFAKEVSKKLVASDYKNNRVEDPTSISAKQEKKVKRYVKEYFDKAVEKYREHEKRKSEREAKGQQQPSPNGVKPSSAEPAGAAKGAAQPNQPDDDDDIVMTDDEEQEGDESPSPSTSSDRKRKRAEDEPGGSPSLTPSETPSAKRPREEDAEAVPSPPPPPPPPPEDAIAAAAETEETEEERCMREQEEALMRENEEAQRLEDEEAEKQQMQRRQQQEQQEQQQQQQHPLSNSDHATTNGATGTRMEPPPAGQQRHKTEVMSH